MSRLPAREWVGIAIGFLVACAAAGVAGGSSFAVVRPGYTFSFPKDHFSHPNYRIEWWYFTGHLSNGKRRFGYELTFFRYGFRRPEIVSNPSAWTPRNLYFAHFAVSDLDQKRFRYCERMNRAALGRAGADEKQGAVFNGSWRWTLGPPWRLHADHADMELDLELEPDKPIVFHGREGYAPKGEGKGEASYYYSVTRLRCRGVLRLGKRSFRVRGTSWMDHEFTSASLGGSGYKGWDWFGLQLDNNVELMIYRLRPRTPAEPPYKLGTVVHTDGTWSSLSGEEIQLTPLSFWRSARSNARYPVAWRLRLPRYGADLTVRADFPAQELITRRSTRVTYWEGSVTIQGRFRNIPVSGEGYAEMTGYAGPLGPGAASNR